MHAVLLSSGGLDSTLAGALVGADVHLTLDYGQRAAKREVHAAEEIAAHFRAEHIVIAAPVGSLLASSLTSSAGSLVGKDTVVPGRNAILLAFATALAQARNLDTVIIGVNADDYATYPDCRPAFIDAFRAVATLGSGVNVIAPLLNHTKASIGRSAKLAEIPFSVVGMTWSCYTDGPEHCGDCTGCITRREALHVYHH